MMIIYQEQNLDINYGKNENDKFFEQIDEINQENSSFAKEKIKKRIT